MKIIDFEDKIWFFLNDGNSYYIDVNCKHSFIGFNMLIQLNTIEFNEYQINGKNYLDSLSNDIQHYALSKYKDRNIKGEAQRIVNETIMKLLEKTNI